MTVIRVIAHEATRTGAPRVLLDLLRAAQPELHSALDVRLMARGPLADELTSLGAATDERPVLVLVNGAAAAGSAAELDDVPLVIYVHEEGDALAVLPAVAREAIAGRADRVFCVSPRARDDLTEMGVEPTRLHILPPVIDDHPEPSADSIASARTRMRAEPASPLVVGCGEAGWRKGADLFVDVVRQIRLHRPRVRAAWVGRRPLAYSRLLDHDTHVSGLDEHLTWLGEVDDPAPYLAAADLLVMTSREDPQPLVPFEAARAGTATAAFDIGGLTDFGQDGLVRVVPYPDTRALATVVSSLLDDAPAREQLVGATRRHIGRHRSPAAVVPRFVAELHELIAAGHRPTGVA